MTSNTSNTAQYDSSMEANLELPVFGDGTMQTSFGLMDVGITHEASADGDAIIHLSLPDRFGVPQATVDLTEMDAITLLAALNRLLDTNIQAEAVMSVQALDGPDVMDVMDKLFEV